MPHLHSPASIAQPFSAGVKATGGASSLSSTPARRSSSDTYFGPFEMEIGDIVLGLWKRGYGTSAIATILLMPTWDVANELALARDGEMLESKLIRGRH